MEKNEEFYEDEYEEGLTLKKVGHFFKVGWLRMVVYTVVVVLLATAIALPIKFLYKSEPVAQTSVEFIYEGIDEGLDPNGGAFNSSSIISTNILSEAVKEAGLSDVITDISKLRAAMRVDGVATDEYLKLVEDAANGNTDAQNTLRNYTMNPSRFDIVISDPKKLNLSDAQAKQLLDKVVESYEKYFAETYAVTNMFESGMYTLSDSELLEYYDIYDLYVASLSPISEYLKLMQTDAPNFVSTKYNTTFGTLISDLNTLQSNYKTFNALLLSNNVWKDKQSAYDSLNANITTVETVVATNEQYIANLKAQLESIKPNTVTQTDGAGAATSTMTYPAIYTELHRELDKMNIENRDYNEQLSNLKERLKNIDVDTETPDAIIARADAMLSALETSTTALVEKVNNTVADYYDTTFVSSSIRRPAPSTVTRKSLGFNIFIVYIVAIIAGLVIGGLVTGIKISKAKTLKEESAAAEAGDKNDAEEGK